LPSARQAGWLPPAIETCFLAPAAHPNALRQLAGSFQIGHGSVGSGIGMQRDLGRSPLVAHRFA
jgi:hypothetical protein